MRRSGFFVVFIWPLLASAAFPFPEECGINYIGRDRLHHILLIKYMFIGYRYYTVKNVNDFPVPSRDVTHQTLPGGEYFNYSRPWRVWFVTSRLGTVK
jgi:hypothetical protein